ncbi:alpha/beta hydrolase [Subtercola sp. Z020]|uniref:alpha/beta hydrolase n=1 Tax=Subtercola sp. Z020 TaxID=2080582 RepID=UPI000CE8D01A|nr:alpha/beta hydrolase [Subtercola sp. Z020]PPF80031.1 alpha/beta hydrolase [Subtercola sp. Z020]
MSGERLAYGDDPDQHGEWWAPAAGGSPIGTAMLLHGGYYRSGRNLDLMHPMAADLASRGWAVWNVEYRRPDGHDWPATLADVRAALRKLRDIPSFAPDAPLVVVGHSAGGQLALQLAEETAAETHADDPPVALAVSLAGVVDLPGAWARGSSDGAVAMALGGSPDEQPERYARASPSLYSGRRVPWLLVQGTDDVADFALPNRDLAANARVGHPELLELPGDHFAVIDPTTPIWHATVARMTERSAAG